MIKAIIFLSAPLLWALAGRLVLKVWLIRLPKLYPSERFMIWAFWPASGLVLLLETFFGEPFDE